MAATSLVLSASPPAVARDRPVEVVVELAAPPAAAARTLAGREAATRSLAVVQRATEARILAAVPGARVRWRYRLVLNGLAVTIPRGSEDALSRIPGIIRVVPSVRYRARLDRGPVVIGAQALWGADPAAGGRGVKIGVIDDGVDPGTPLLEAHGLAAPAGFPRGNPAYTNGRVIVARSFPAAVVDDVAAAHLPFDRLESFHGTHVAGIAAGAAGVVAPASAGRPTLVLSGVAPGAWIGNYRALTVPTDSGVGLDGNSPEIVAAIEAAVADGMDVLNLSLGQPEVAPGRDLVARALDNAAAMGVVPVVAAGNDYPELGRGSVASPGSATGAITVAAVTADRTIGLAAGLTGAPVPAILEAFAIAPLSLGSPADRVVGPLVVAPPDGDATLCAHGGAVEPASIVVVHAGGCGLEQKARVAARLGASALLAIAAGPAQLHASLDTALPVLGVSAAVGSEIVAQLATGATPVLVVRDEPAALLDGGAGIIAPFSAAGPTPLGLRLKPDVSAPGVDVLSAYPTRRGRFAFLSGTSMAAPHVAGAVALLVQRHPGWSVEQIRSALVVTGTPVFTGPDLRRQAPPTRQGGGLVDVGAALDPLVHASPTALSLGLLGPANRAAATIELTDAGGGAGQWQASVEADQPPRGAGLVVAATVDVPGRLDVAVDVSAGAREGDREGWIVLTRGGERRRIPFWLRVTRPALSIDGARVLAGNATVEGDTRRAPSRVTRYRYPDVPTARGLRGPEQAFIVAVPRPVANVGAAVVWSAQGVRVEPRLLLGPDENRLAGPTGLPLVTNPYLASFGLDTPIVAALRPEPGRVVIVVDSRSGRTAGRYRVRIWVDDVTPPRVVRVSGRARNGLLRARIVDRGSGVDPESLRFSIDDRGEGIATWDERRGEAIIPVGALPAGRHRLELVVSDRQEAKNTEYADPVLANTSSRRTTFVVEP